MRFFAPACHAFLLLPCHTLSLALNALGVFCSLIICATLFARPRSIYHTHKPNHLSTPRVFFVCSPAPYSQLCAPHFFVCAHSRACFYAICPAKCARLLHSQPRIFMPRAPLFCAPTQHAVFLCEFCFFYFKFCVGFAFFWILKFV